MATSEGIPSSIDIEFLELNDNPYFTIIFLFNFFRSNNRIEFLYIRRKNTAKSCTTNTFFKKKSTKPF